MIIMKLYYQRPFPVLPPYELNGEGKYVLDTFRNPERNIEYEDVFYMLQYYSPEDFVNKANCLYRGFHFPPDPILGDDRTSLGKLYDCGCHVATMGFPEYPQKWIEKEKYFIPLATRRKLICVRSFSDERSCFSELNCFLRANNLDLPYSIVAKEEHDEVEYMLIYYYNTRKYTYLLHSVPVLSFVIVMDNGVDPNDTLIANREKDLKGSPEPTEPDIYFKNYMNYRKDILNAKPSDFE